MNADQLIGTLQTSTGPVIVISGVGLLLLSMTNRYGRIIDRARLVAHSLRDPSMADDHDRQRTAIKILCRRARLVRTAILLSVLSLICIAVLIIVLFITSIWHSESPILVTSLFSSCMVSLVGSLIAFIWDVNISLDALDLEIPPEAPRLQNGK